MNRYPICANCNKQLNKFAIYCSDKCKIKDDLRFRLLYEWDLLHPYYSYIESKEREKILDMCEKQRLK